MMRGSLAAVVIPLVLARMAFAAPPTTPETSPQAWFYSHVVPKLVANGCVACHATGYLRPQVTTYEELLPYLAMGWTEENNVLLVKMANLRSIAPDRPTHPGGQRCISIDAEPCVTLRAWWQHEFGPNAAKRETPR